MWAEKMNEFKSFHPIVSFFYFAAVLLFAMFFMHPVCILISLICSFTYAAILNGKKAVRLMGGMIPLILLSALMNPLFNHEGVSIIAYFPNGNPLTKESVIYGFAAAATLCSVIMWFSCFNAVMTSDKFIYLFGRVIPSLSLVLSMALRLVPRLAHRAKEINDAQKCVGRGVSQGNILRRMKNALCVFSILVTWALENSLEISDSMKSQGYGLPKRSAFSNFKLDGRDAAALCGTAFFSLYVLFGRMRGVIYCRYFPSFAAGNFSECALSVFAAYFLLCIEPVAIELLEDVKWRALRSKI